MTRTRLNVSVADQDLTITSEPLIASGGENEDEVKFTFTDATWSGLTLSAVFYRKGMEAFAVLLDSDGIGIIPSGVTLDEGTIYVGLMGTNASDAVVKTSEMVRITISRGAISSRAVVQRATSDVYLQLLTAYGEAKEVYLQTILDDVTEVYNDTVSAKNTAVEAKNTAVASQTAIEAMLSGLSAEGIFGAKFTKTASAGTHTHDAVGLTYRRYVGNSGTTQTLSDFRSLSWWALIKNVLKDPSTNELVAVEGDSDFETKKATNNYNLFVRFPKYFYDVVKIVEDSVEKVEFLMSLKPFAGCKVLKAFKDKDYVDISAFKTNSAYESKFDSFPRVNTTLSTFITNFNSKNQRNQTLLDEYVWLIPMIIETASLNSQSAVGTGVDSNNYGSGDTYKVKEATTNANTVTILKSRTLYVGETICLESSNGSLTNNRRIVSIADHASDSTLQVITFDGDPLSLTTAMFCDVHVQRSPLQAEYDAMGKNLGYYNRGNQDRSHVYVYGLCDPWGNVFEGLSGTLRYKEHLWVNWTDGASIPSSFDEDNPPEGWHKIVAYGTEEFSDGYIGSWDFAFDFDGQLIIYVTGSGGNSTNPIGDYEWGENDMSLRFPWLGGAFTDSSLGGAFSLNWRDFTNSRWYCSARSVG